MAYGKMCRLTTFTQFLFFELPGESGVDILGGAILGVSFRTPLVLISSKPLGN